MSDVRGRLVCRGGPAAGLPAAWDGGCHGLAGLAGAGPWLPGGAAVMGPWGTAGMLPGSCGGHVAWPEMAAEPGPRPAAWPALAAALTHRLLYAGLAVQSASALAGAQAASRLQQVLDQLDAIIGDTRTAAFESRALRHRHGSENQ